MKKEDLLFLNQLIHSFEEAEPKLEKYYKKKDNEKFNKAKKIMLQIQKQISETIR
ncbi:hypothetical protein KAJ87_00310 [Candidatus Pacearchaeota archaeon]|nr:hypothetical protein [Candidatus Pacearchaeota archaeon]